MARRSARKHNVAGSILSQCRLSAAKTISEFFSIHNVCPPLRYWLLVSVIVTENGTAVCDTV